MTAEALMSEVRLLLEVHLNGDAWIIYSQKLGNQNAMAIVDFIGAPIRKMRPDLNGIGAWKKIVQREICFLN